MNSQSLCITLLNSAIAILGGENISSWSPMTLISLAFGQKTLLSQTSEALLLKGITQYHICIAVLMYLFHFSKRINAGL